MTGDNLVVGLASYIVDECASSYPDFFTRLSTYDPWLKEMVCGQALNKPTYCPTTSTGGGGATEDGSGDSGGTSDPLSPLTECLTIFLGFLNGFGRGIMDAIRG